MSPSGRRSGPTTTAQDILDAARKLFAQNGYRDTTVRSVAAEAGVTAGLVHHFYGSKERLFLAATALPLHPVELVAGVVAGGPRRTLGERVVRAFVRVWRDPATGPQIVAVFRRALGTEGGSAFIREFTEGVMIPQLAVVLGIPPLRVTAIMSQLVGLGIGRDLIGVGPLADASEDELAALFGPVVQGHLDP